MKRTTTPIVRPGARIIIIAVISFLSIFGSSAAAQTVNALPTGTNVAIRMVDAINSETSSLDTEYKGSLDDALVVDGTTVAAVGTPAFLRVVQIKQAGAVSGRATLSLRLVAVEINGRRVAVETGDATTSSGSQTGRAVKNGVAGAVVGGVLGAIFGGGKGALKGAAAGAAAGTVVAIVQGQKVEVAAEARMSFTLTQPAQIAPSGE